MLHRGTGDNAAVVALAFDLIDRFVEVQQMLSAGVFAFMGGRCNQVHFHLQRRVPDQPQKLNLRFDLFRHEIHQSNLQRADILCERAPLVHNRDILPLQRPGSRQILRYNNGHYSFARPASRSASISSMFSIRFRRMIGLPAAISCSPRAVGAW